MSLLRLFLKALAVGLRCPLRLRGGSLGRIAGTFSLPYRRGVLANTCSLRSFRLSCRHFRLVLHLSEEPASSHESPPSSARPETGPDCARTWTQGKLGRALGLTNAL